MRSVSDNEEIVWKGRNVNTPVKDKQGALLTSEKEQEQRQIEHFKEVLNSQQTQS